MLVDLLGEKSDLLALVGDADAPGITDLLEYGVSLRRAAHGVKGTPNLFVMPGGVELPLQPYYLTHARWRTLVEDFHDAGALLLIAAPPLVPDIELLLERLEGLVVVRGAATPVVLVPTLADVRLPTQQPPTKRRTPTMGRPRAEPEPPRSRLTLLALAVIAALALVAAVWYVRPWWSPSPAPARAAVRGTAAPSAATPPAPVYDTIPPLPAEWGVELSSVNSAAGAAMRLTQVVDSFPAATYSPTVPVQGGVSWYRLVAGALPDSETADALLREWRTNGKVGINAGRPVRMPLALMVNDSVDEAGARTLVRTLRERGLPGYMLHLGRGHFRVYVGAFEQERSAGRLQVVLDSLKLPAALVSRVGRAF